MINPKKVAKKMDSETAKKLLLKEQEENIKKCSAEVQQVLEKHGMQMQANAVIPATQVQIVPKLTTQR